MAATTVVEPVVDRRDDPVSVAQLGRIAAAAASLGAAAVHASAIGGHSDDAVHAAAFVAMATFQASFAYAVLRSLAARVLLAGAVGHGSILLLWVLSRTSGVPPWLPGGGGREPAGGKDLVAAALAVVVLAAVDVLSRRATAARLVRASRAGATVAAVVLAVAVASTAASFAAGHHHDPAAPHDGAGHDH
jgi:hypothetical protein